MEDVPNELEVSSNDWQLYGTGTERLFCCKFAKGLRAAEARLACSTLCDSRSHTLTLTYMSSYSVVGDVCIKTLASPAHYFIVRSRLNES